MMLVMVSHLAIMALMKIASQQALQTSRSPKLLLRSRVHTTATARTPITSCILQTPCIHIHLQMDVRNQSRMDQEASEHTSALKLVLLHLAMP